MEECFKSNLYNLNTLKVLNLNLYKIRIYKFLSMLLIDRINRLPIKEWTIKNVNEVYENLELIGKGTYGLLISLY